jgi:hypothetical protein
MRLRHDQMCDIWQYGILGYNLSKTGFSHLKINANCRNWFPNAEELNQVPLSEIQHAEEMKV